MDGQTIVWQSFIIGSIATAAVLLIIGWLWNLVQGWLKKMNAPDKPQAIVHLTRDTPSKVIADAQIARRKLMTLVLFFGFCGWAILQALYPTEMWAFEMMLLKAGREFIRLIVRLLQLIGSSLS